MHIESIERLKYDLNEYGQIEFYGLVDGNGKVLIQRSSEEEAVELWHQTGYAPCDYDLISTYRMDDPKLLESLDQDIDEILLSSESEED